MGTAREPVVGSGVWPAWTARVARCCFASDITFSFWVLCFGFGARQRLVPGRANQAKRPESCVDPGRLTSRSVAPSAFASQKPHGRVRTPCVYTYTGP